MADVSERVDSLAPTKDDSDVPEDLASRLEKVDVAADTVATPSKLTLVYSKDTPAKFTDHFPKSVKVISVEERCVLGRNDDAQIFLNSDEMSKLYGEIKTVKGDSSSFTLKNISSKKLIEVTYSKGKKHMSEKLKCGEETTIRTNYIIKFLTLQFKVVISPGDDTAENFELEVTREVPRTVETEVPRAQPVLLNTGQINKLYMGHRPVDHSSGKVQMSMSNNKFRPEVMQTGPYGPMASVDPDLAALPVRPPGGYPNGGHGTGWQMPQHAPDYMANPPRYTPRDDSLYHPRGHPVNYDGHPMGNYGHLPYSGYPADYAGHGAHPMYHGHPTGYGGHPPLNPMYNTGYPVHGQGVYGGPIRHPQQASVRGTGAFCPTPLEVRTEDHLLSYSISGKGSLADDIGKLVSYQGKPMDSYPGGMISPPVHEDIRLPVENSELPDPVARVMQKADLRADA